MKTLRYNAFNQIHKGLRALLYDTAIAIQHTDFLLPAQVHETFGKIEKTLWLFEGHAHTEDELLFPLLQSLSPDIVMDFEQQHQRDHELGESLRKLINAYNNAEDANARIHCGILLLQAFNEFTAFNLEHMNREETIINEALWQHYTDQDILAIEKTIVASIPAEKNPWYWKWMMRGLNNTEIITWLKKVKAFAPTAIFEALTGVAARELPTDRWTAIRQNTEEHAAMAGA